MTLTEEFAQMRSQQFAIVFARLQDEGVGGESGRRGGGQGAGTELLHGGVAFPGHLRQLGLRQRRNRHTEQVAGRHPARERPFGSSFSRFGSWDYSSGRIALAILRTRSMSAIASISTILPLATVNPITAVGRPPTMTTTPAAPFTSVGCS